MHAGNILNIPGRTPYLERKILVRNVGFVIKHLELRSVDRRRQYHMPWLHTFFIQSEIRRKIDRLKIKY